MDGRVETSPAATREIPTTRARRVPVWVIAAILIAATVYGVARARRDFWDFEVYRTAATRVLAAEPLYRPDDGHYQFESWPAFGLAMIPFAFLPLEVSKAVWYALSVWLLIVFVRRSIALLPDRRLSERALVWLVVLLTGKFVVRELVNGQTNVLLGLLIVLAVAATERRRQVLAGVLVGLAVFVKPYALVLLPWLAVAGRSQASGAAALTLAAGLALPAMFYGWQGNLDLLAEWYRTVTDTTAPNLLVAENISTSALWAKWIGVSPRASTLAAISSAAVLAVAALPVLLRRRTGRPAYLEAGLLMLVVPVVSPQGWDYVLLIGVPAMLCLVDRWRDVSVAWRLIIATALFVTSLSIYDLVGRSVYFWLMGTSAITIAVAVLVIAAVHLRWRGLA